VTITKIKAALARPWVRRTVTALFLAIVGALIAKQATLVDWQAVAGAIGKYDRRNVTICFALTALSYLIYSCFDVIGRSYIGSRLPVRTFMRVAFISYAFNQSFGSLIGGVAFRFRLYAHVGLDAVRVSKIILFSVFTNWLGYSMLAGLLFLSGAIALPQKWSDSRLLLQIIGAVLICTAITYLVVCAIGKQTTIRFKKQELRAPALRLAIVQLLLSIAHWPLTAAIVFVLLQGKIEFVTILGAMLLSAVAAVIAHIPAGIGVLEAVFLGLLGRRLPISELLAALVVFRAIYQLTPLALATAVYLPSEFKQRRTTQKGLLLRR